MKGRTGKRDWVFINIKPFLKFYFKSFKTNSCLLKKSWSFCLPFSPLFNHFSLYFSLFFSYSLFPMFSSSPFFALFPPYFSSLFPYFSLYFLLFPMFSLFLFFPSFSPPLTPFSLFSPLIPSFSQCFHLSPFSLLFPQFPSFFLFFFSFQGWIAG